MFYDKNEYILTFQSRRFRKSVVENTIRHIYKPFISLLKQALLDLDLYESVTFSDNRFQFNDFNTCWYRNNLFVNTYGFSYVDLREQCIKYGKPYSLTNEAYNTFRFDGPSTLISLAGILGNEEFIPILREIAVHTEHNFMRTKAILSLYDIGTPKAMIAGVEAIVAGLGSIDVSDLMDKLGDYGSTLFDARHEPMIPLFVQIMISPKFFCGKESVERSKNDGENELRAIQELFAIAASIGTKKAADFIFEFGIRSPFIDIQAMGHTMLRRLARNDKTCTKYPFMSIASKESSRRLASIGYNKKSNGSRLFAPNMIGALVSMKW